MMLNKFNVRILAVISCLALSSQIFSMEEGPEAIKQSMDKLVNLNQMVKNLQFDYKNLLPVNINFLSSLISDRKGEPTYQVQLKQIKNILGGFPNSIINNCTGALEFCNLILGKMENLKAALNRTYAKA